jgi:hypothetical protein
VAVAAATKNVVKISLGNEFEREFELPFGKSQTDLMDYIVKFFDAPTLTHA